MIALLLALLVSLRAAPSQTVQRVISREQARFAAAGGWPRARALSNHPLALVAVLAGAHITVAGAAFQHATAWREPEPHLPAGTAPSETPTVVDR